MYISINNIISMYHWCNQNVLTMYPMYLFRMYLLYLIASYLVHNRTVPTFHSRNLYFDSRTATKTYDPATKNEYGYMFRYRYVGYGYKYGYSGYGYTRYGYTRVHIY